MRPSHLGLLITLGLPASWAAPALAGEPPTSQLAPPRLSAGHPALRAQGGAPREAGPFSTPDLVELVKLDPTLKLDVRYATTNNFVHRKVYDEARAFLQRPAAEALLAAHRALRDKGYGILVFDGYRPWSVTKLFWDLSPPAERPFVANPAKGSVHNRGCAADVSLFDLRTGREVEMPSPYDETSERADPGYGGGTAEQRARRDLLRKSLEQVGFTVEPNEWWHYNFRGCRYPILDVPFSTLGRPGNPR